MRIYAGCSGFFYRDWVGCFYPALLKREDYIRFYAEYFDVVEINASFYSFPNPNSVKSMLQRTSKLRFAFKAHRSFTHYRVYEKEDVKKFLNTIEPVLKEDRFIALLFQFPESFNYGEESLEYLKRLSEDFRTVRKVVEVRSRSFKKSDFYPFLEELGFSLVNTDAPKGKRFFLGPWLSVGPIGYVRLHGRNPEKLYDYQYSLEELKKIREKVRKLKGEEVYVFFNNTVRAQAVLNALQFKLLLGVKTEIPTNLQRSLREKEWE